MYALAVWNGDLVVGGRCSRITTLFVSLTATNLAKLNATTGWSALSASPITTNMAGPYVNALAIFNNTV